jgi:hypothetical protein
LKMTFVKLKDSLEIDANDFSVGDKEASIVVKNLKNAYVNNLVLRFSSSFFEESKQISLEPYESTTVKVLLDQEALSQLSFGSYVVRATADADGYIAQFESAIEFLPRESISQNINEEGFFVRRVSVSKTNEGNVPVVVSLEIKKDIFSRLFTVFSQSPSSIRREGTSAYYLWEQRIGPGESFQVSGTTSYTFPIFFILLIVVLTFLVYTYARTSVVLNKQVNFVKTKGGEFALKVTLRVKARKHVEDIQVIDMLPGMTMLYEKFGIKPDKIDHAPRRIHWKIDRLNAGEERVYSYIIYSKVRIVGRFELPSATAIFEREGRTHEVLSNRAFFLADTLGNF